MRFCQLIEYIKKNIFLQKSCRKWSRETRSRPFKKKKKKKKNKKKEKGKKKQKIKKKKKKKSFTWDESKWSAA